MTKKPRRVSPYSATHPYIPPVRSLGPRVNLAIRLNGVIIAALLLIVLAAFGMNLVLAIQNVETEARTELDVALKVYSNRLSEIQNSAETLVSIIADRKDLQDLMIAGDREGLLAQIVPLWNSLNVENKLDYLLIDDIAGNVFASAPDPSEFGKNVLYRSTVTGGLAEWKATSGVEVIENYIVSNAVAPLITGSGELVGFIEVGFHFDEQFLADLKFLTGADYRIWIRDSVAIPAGYELPDEAPKAPVSNLVFYRSTGDEELTWSASEYSMILETYNTLYKSGKDQDRSGINGLMVSLIGYDGQPVGVVEIYHSTQALVANLRYEQIIAAIANLGLGLLASIALYLLFHLWFIRPLNHLTKVAGLQLDGDVRFRTNIKTGDEFEKIGAALNLLADNVEAGLLHLEDLVYERTADLTLAAEVGSSFASIRDLETLLSTSVERICSRFELYYCQIYLVDSNEQAITLKAASGQAGAEMLQRGHWLMIDEGSIVSRAAADRRPVVVSDIRHSSLFSANPLLPETQSEIALPLIFSERLLGVLDLQSKTADALNIEWLPALEILTGHLAIAIDNAALYSYKQDAADLQVNRLLSQPENPTTSEEMIAGILKNIDIAKDKETIIRAAIEGLEKALNKEVVLVMDETVSFGDISDGEIPPESSQQS